MSTYNTNLASEFHVLSMLHRLGLDAVLTLGNKKMVDIVVTKKNGDILTIDVKGIAKKYDWPADNIRAPRGKTHFIALVSYEGGIEDPTRMPNVWLIPHNKIRYFIKEYRIRKNVSRPLIISNGEKYRDAWHLLK